MALKFSLPKFLVLTSQNARTEREFSARHQLDSSPERYVEEDASMPLTAASLIGCLGQAHFLSFIQQGSFIRVTLLFAVCFGVRRAPLHACVGMVVESPAFRRASICAADIFGFIHTPRPDERSRSG